MGVITTALTAAAAVGKAVMDRKVVKEQQQMAEISNARERKKALASARLARAKQEAMGVASNTAGSSSQVGAMGATSSNVASAIGFQNSQLASMNKITQYNNASTGFGLLQTAGSFAMQNPDLVKQQGQKVKGLFS